MSLFLGNGRALGQVLVWVLLILNLMGPGSEALKCHCLVTDNPGVCGGKKEIDCPGFEGCIKAANAKGETVLQLCNQVHKNVWSCLVKETGGSDDCITKNPTDDQWKNCKFPPQPPRYEGKICQCYSDLCNKENLGTNNPSGSSSVGHGGVVSGVTIMAARLWTWKGFI